MKPKYETPEEMEKTIKEYFQMCDAGKEEKWVDKRGNYQEQQIPTPYTIEGAALYIGFNSREGLYRYANKSEVHKGVLTRLRAQIVKHTNEKALLGQYDSKVALRIAAVIDPGYRDSLDVHQTVTHELGPKLQEALQLASAARKMLPAHIMDVKAITAQVSQSEG
uniref:Putative terminase small subunit n=1 Tax=viral metagenome TaxID=1070528 RepID=A0A6H1ZN14_9ZZZZ